MANATTMTFNGYNFSPVPTVSIDRKVRKNKKQILGFDFTITLTGVLFNDGGFVDTTAEMTALREACVGCSELLIKCDDSYVLAAQARAGDVSFSESSNNWTNTIPYTITLEYIYDEAANENPNQDSERIESIEETWEFEFIQEHKFFSQDLSTLDNQAAGKDYTETDSNNPFEARVTHNVNVVGKDICISATGVNTTGDFGDGLTAVDHAMYYLTNHVDLSYSPTSWGHSISGVTNLSSDSDSYLLFDHYRSHVVDESNGSVDLRQSWLVLGANTGLVNRKAREDFSVSFNKSLSENLYRVSIEGQVEGFEERGYSTVGSLNPISGGNAYDNATNTLNEVKDRFFPRAQSVFQANISDVAALNPVPANTSYGYSPSKGIITYNLEYNNRPCSFISGSLTEDISIVDNHPADVFASLAVLGRAAGPVLQEISTFTSATRDISIEVTMPTPTGCTFADLQTYNPEASVSGLLCQFETELTDANDQVFKNSDNENWNPLSGRYSRSVSWTYAGCDDSGNTSFC